MFQKVEKIVVWGDSVAKGVIFDDRRNRYAISKQTAVKQVSDALGTEIVNRSKMGRTITEGFLTMQTDLEKGLVCDVGVIEFGGNDSDFYWDQISSAPDRHFESKTPIGLFAQKLREMIAFLKQRGIRPVLMTLPPVNASRYFDFITRNLNPANILKWLGTRETIYRFHEQYSAVIAEIARETGCVMIDLRSAFAAQADDPSLLCMDGVHPNDKGQALIGRTVLNAI